MLPANHRLYYEKHYIQLVAFFKKIIKIPTYLL